MIMSLHFFGRTQIHNVSRSGRGVGEEGGIGWEGASDEECKREGTESKEKKEDSQTLGTRAGAAAR